MPDGKTDILLIVTLVARLFVQLTTKVFAEEVAVKVPVIVEVVALKFCPVTKEVPL